MDTREYYAKPEGAIRKANLSVNANASTRGHPWTPKIRGHTDNRKTGNDKLQEMGVSTSHPQDMAVTVMIDPNMTTRSDTHKEPWHVAMTSYRFTKLAVLAQHPFLGSLAPYIFSRTKTMKPPQANEVRIMTG